MPETSAASETNQTEAQPRLQCRHIRVSGQRCGSLPELLKSGYGDLRFSGVPVKSAVTPFYRATFHLSPPRIFNPEPSTLDPRLERRVQRSSSAAPNPAAWTYDTGAGGWGNGELETYCAPSSTVPPCNPAQPNIYQDGQGHLVIQALRLPRRNRRDNPFLPHHARRLRSRLPTHRRHPQFAIPAHRVR